MNTKKQLSVGRRMGGARRARAEDRGESSGIRRAKEGHKMMGVAGWVDLGKQLLLLICAWMIDAMMCKVCFFPHFFHVRDAQKPH